MTKIMKTSVKKAALLVSLTMLLASCEDFLDRYPQSDITDNYITFTRSEMELMANAFYPAMPGYQPNTYAAGIYWFDNNSDNLVHVNYDFNTQLAGTIVPPASGGGWDWTRVRNLNYIIDQIEKAASVETEETMNHFRGEFRFWRAYFYYDLLKQFGDLPWIDKPMETNSPELFHERVSRSLIVDNILADLDFAIANMRSSAQVTNLRISREVALLFKSKVALYEGTWEKYHAGSDFGTVNPDPAKYFRASVSAAQQLIEQAGHLGLYMGGDSPDTDYWNVFNKVDYAANPEILLWKRFDVNVGLHHYGQMYLQERGGNTGLSKQLVESYLCTDGRPISVSNLYGGDASVEVLSENRDPRLSQTMYLPGHVRQVRGVDTVFFSLPNLTQEGEFGNRTGYQLYKGTDPDFGQRDRSSSGSIVLRYAEALLNYAEAAAELGECTQDVLDATINRLRDRVGMPHLTVGVGFTDPNWDFPALSPLLNEIRRERRVELACEGYRFDDLMRWAAADIIKKPMLGAKFSQFVGKPFNPPISSNILVNADGYIAPYQNSPAANGRQFDPSKHYLKPIPTNEITLNPALTQNPNY